TVFLPQLLKLASDADARVRFQLAFTLGEMTDARAIDALAIIALRDAADPWIRTAVLSSVAHTSDRMLTRLLPDAQFVSSRAVLDRIRELAQILGVRGQTPELQRVLASVGVSGGLASPVLGEVVSGIGEGLKRSGKSLRSVAWNTENNGAIDLLLSRATQ